jgi:uncharacterized protein YhbP (UPF0306 family)
MELKELITEYLDKSWFMQLATVKENKPWVCTVHFAHDNAFNFYWVSLPTRRHSLELVTNENIAGAIVQPITVKDKPRGIQFEGIAREISNADEIRQKIGVYEQKFEKENLGEDMISGASENKLYVVQPKKIVLFDVVNFPENPRQEIEL